MTRDESEQIDELLDLWYRWAKAYRPALGAPRVSPYGRDVEPDAGNVHDDDGVEARLNAAVAEQVDACLNALPWQLRSAVGIHTANKEAGAEVYRNPRLTKAEQHMGYQEAKAELLPMLRVRNLVKRAA